MFAMGVGVRKHLHTIRHADASWTFGIVPVCVPSLPTAEGRAYHYGGGASFGVEFEPRKQLRLQPYFDAGGGVLMFTEPTPVESSRRFNVSLQFGPGVRLPLKGRSSLRMGMWYFHFSDAHTTESNPGFVGFLFYAGYAFSFRRDEGRGNGGG